MLQQMRACPISFQPIVISAHSMVNVVVGNALQRLGSQTRSKIRAFISCQAAVSAHVFDGSLTNPLNRFGILYTVADGGPTTANVYRDVLADVRTYPTFNFYNADDYALSENAWQVDQATKPNNGYDYTHGPTPTDPGAGFLPDEAEWHDRWVQSIGAHAANQTNRYHWRQTLLPLERFPAFQHFYPPNSRYAIMAFMSEPRIRAAGTVAQPWTNDIRELERPKYMVDFQRLWPDYKPHRYKDADNNENDKPYSGHRWHSAQFRMTLAEQAAFWQAFINKAFGIGRAGYLKPVAHGQPP